VVLHFQARVGNHWDIEEWIGGCVSRRSGMHGTGLVLD
jgi:hypothetical protein